MTAAEVMEMVRKVISPLQVPDSESCALYCILGGFWLENAVPIAFYRLFARVCL
jgi:hypothetical protein